MAKSDREEVKKTFADLKGDFKVAVRDKKRWIVCLIELLIMCALLAVDQLTKKFIYGHCKDVADIIIWDGVIRFTAVENTGASFGIFGSSTAALTAVSLICSIILILFIFYSYKRRNLWLRSALILLTAGALGNVVDRLALGYVRDMVYFELIDFAVFNFADSCLTVGTVVLIIYLLFFYTKEEEELRKARAAEGVSGEKGLADGGEEKATSCEEADPADSDKTAVSENTDLSTDLSSGSDTDSDAEKSSDSGDGEEPDVKKENED